jgi:hypothetical protein
MGNPGKGLFWSSLTDMSMGTAYLVEPVDSYYPLKKLRSGYAVAIFNRRICQFDLKVKKGVETVQNLIGL